jgi:hypothetical protein
VAFDYFKRNKWIFDQVGYAQEYLLRADDFEDVLVVINED